MNDLYLVRVKFFSNSIKKSLSNFNAVKTRYSPHLVIKGDYEYLGVTFSDDGANYEYDKEINVLVESIYDGMGYYKLVEGAEFLIMEGPHIVGEGIVKDIIADEEKME